MLMMAHERTATDADPTEGIDMGVVWEEAEDAPDRDDETVHGTVVRTGGTPEAQTPKRALLDDINTRLRARLEAWNTYALLAWSRRWETAESYVMDPNLLQELLDEAERDLDRQRLQAAKHLRKAKVLGDEERRAAERAVDRLNRRGVSMLDINARVLRARGGRLARQAALPVAVVVGPIVALVGAGMWWPLLAYPVAWGWLALQGHAIAVAAGTVEAKETEPLQEKARVLAASGGAPPASATAPVVGASEAENAILDHIADWKRRSKRRGLEGVTPAAPTLDALGIRVVLTTTGRLTPEALLRREDALRAALDVPADTKTTVSPGDSGEEAVLRIRTRTPELDTAWRPDRTGVGFVAETGRVVDVEAYGHRLVAGVTGAGKSTSMRPWMASVVLNPIAALVFVDPKGQEAGLWEHCARTVKGVGADGQAAMYEVICDVVDELEWRQEHADGTDWRPSRDHPELVVVIDEGAALVRMAKTKEYRDVLAKIEYLATQGRAGRVWVHWATQYPTKADGIPAQVAENIVTRMCLALDSPQADRVVFGEQATATGWSPSRLDLPGWSLVRTQPTDAPEQIACWHMDDDQVRTLPPRQPWRRTAGAPRQKERDESGIPPVLRAALVVSEGARGATSHEIATGAGMDVLDTQEGLRDAGVVAGRFVNAEGRQVRGYPRQALEEAARSYES